MLQEVVIDRRFRGPPASANGGYTCGILAQTLGSIPAEVNLRLPPPLDRPLRIERGGATARLLDGDALVADATRLGDFAPELPEPPPLHLAEDADARSDFYDDHSFPGCFVCGPDREPGDGLCIYPGAVEGTDVIACAWTPDPRFAEPSGRLREEIVWAALDCPSGIAAHHFARDERTMVLARLRGKLAGPVEVAQPHIVVGWAGASEGRKHASGTAIFDAAGAPLAFAEALWIELREEPGSSGS